MHKFKLCFGSGGQENSKNFKTKTKNKDARKILKLLNFKEQTTVGTVSIRRSMTAGDRDETELHNTVLVGAADDGTGGWAAELHNTVLVVAAGVGTGGRATDLHNTVLVGAAGVGAGLGSGGCEDDLVMKLNDTEADSGDSSGGGDDFVLVHVLASRTFLLFLFRMSLRISLAPIPHDHLSPSSAVGRARVGLLGGCCGVSGRGRGSSRSSLCCPGCGLVGDGNVCETCMMGVHGGDERNSCVMHGVNSCTSVIQKNLRVVRSQEARGETKMPKLQVGRLIVGNLPVNSRLAHYLRWAPRRWPIEA